AVKAAKDYIRRGDIFQVVLSQRFFRPTKASDLDIYRALRVVNPSPYMFLLRLPGVSLIGSSPEMLVRVRGLKVEQRPIAGTRPRGRTPGEDAFLERDLLSDEKERAEHVMLVDLARNDVGRVCEPGTVKVPELMVVERYSHVMHIVSHIEGRLEEGFSPIDALRASFPAGTVSGAPKVRAMQIISELEPVRRGPYAGAVFYLSASGDLDSCITIRTLLLKEGTAYVQAGAGIVWDSEPSREFEETVNKAKAMFAAIALAEGVREVGAHH
ncbi:MAG TPA: anthranilate synthase component I family protein, partial [Armatimonadetes bacterium]|nr:anthranilate synthase component I family protein [Armatimonadota bacterium]